ncbi:MAG: DUF4234 domain-containing protein [Candidatus Thiodiazotropha sp.]
MHNPYNAPKADLATQDEQSDSLAIFPRFSTWFVFFLSLATLGLYILYWLYHRTRILNRLKGISPISDTFIFLSLGFNVVSIPVNIGEAFVKHNQEYILASNILYIVSTLLLLIWAFKFRHSLNDFLEKSPHPSSRLGPVFTFLFQSLYLSYKINQNLELENTAQESLPHQAEENPELDANSSPRSMGSDQSTP